MPAGRARPAIAPRSLGIRRTPCLFALALLALTSFACSQDGGSTATDNPVAAQSSELTSLVGAVQAQTNICHWDPDWELEGEPFEYHVIAISTNGNSPAAHAAHGDPACDVSGLLVGDDCSSCVAAVAPQTVTAAAKADSELICHNDVDDEEAYDSIAIVVNGNSVEAHLANHGDCLTEDLAGTENCACLAI